MRAPGRSRPRSWSTTGVLLAGSLLGLAGLATRASLAGDKVSYVKVYLEGDRIIEGELVGEDDDSITVKTELATAPLPKREVLTVTRSTLTPDEIVAKKKAKSSYTSLLLGYRIMKADAARWKLDPPAPLADVVIFDDKEKSEIRVDGNVDQNPTLAMDDAALEGFTKSIESRLREKFRDVKRLGSSKTTLKGEPGFLIEFSTTRKETKDEWHQGVTIVKHKGKELYLGVSAPVAHYDKAKAAYQAVLDSFEFTEANTHEGDRLFSQDFLFAIDKPEDWTWTKTPTPKAATGEVELAAPKNEATVHVTASTVDRATTLDGWAKARFAELAGATGLADAKASPPTSANVCFRRAAQATTEYGPANARRKRTVYLLKEQEQGYEITIDLPAVEKSALQPIANEVVSRFRILNSLLAEGALEKGLKAIDLFDEGDKALSDNKFAPAAASYEQAVDVYPRFAAAWNNLALARLRGGEVEKAGAAAQKAYDLYPEDRLIRTNVALIKLHEAQEQIKAKKVDEAARLCDSARSAAPPDMDDALKADFASMFAAVGFLCAEKDNFDKAMTWLDKALGLKPKDPELSKNAAIICANAAVVNYNKRSTGAATTWARRALKYDPACAKAKEILDAINKKK